MLLHTLFLTLLPPLTLSQQVFQWPDHQLSALEDGLYMQGPFLDEVRNCEGRDNTTTTAQWVRLAYHDSATHDIADGSGGLDASIRFELDRQQNIGSGMTDSVQEISNSMNPFTSLADFMAMAVTIGVHTCGGPSIPFRYGRIDATSAGPATVPEPQQSLDEHIQSFKRQGFSQSDMIKLVACGHTLGGVRKVDFPLVVSADTQARVASFDTTTQFDNVIVTQYLDGTTRDVLVVGENVTTRSDARIFGSDQNVTMQSISSPEDFSNTCRDILQRMIETVPKTVNLVGPIEPIANKVRAYTLNTISDSPTNTSSSATNQTLKLFWEGQGTASNSTGSVDPSEPAFDSPGGGRTINMFASFEANAAGVNSMAAYFFSAQIPLDVGLGKFWFTADGETVDNNGKGFVIEQLELLHDPDRSLLFFVPPQTFDVASVRLVFAVRSETAAAADFSISMDVHGSLSNAIFSEGPGVDVPVTTVQLTPDDTTNPPADGYRFFAATVQDESDVQSVIVTVESGGQKFTLYVESTEFATHLFPTELSSEP
ncbi:heme peroxidase [Mycena rosella]|uniref:Peroxidase n=1 Tax=Mycena rosella TaxID=1033263 RepID=A0AAD7FZ50_MYCRO|nr:heme peroxidase [Mycena rosella]